MNIYVSVQLAEGDVMEESLDEIADGVFAVLGADENKDYCSVSIIQPSTPPGTAGTPPGPPPPETP